MNLVNGSSENTETVETAACTARAPRRSWKGEQTRERLVECAKDIFAELGYAATRVKDIAERAGQSHPSFYYYFDSKHEIFREVVVSVDRTLSATFNELFASDPLSPAQPEIQDAMRRHLESCRNNARILTLIDEVSRTDASIQSLRLASQKELTTRMASTIRSLQQRHIADPDLDPEISAIALGGLIQRFADLWFTQGAVDCELSAGVEHLSHLFVGAFGLRGEEQTA